VLGGLGGAAVAREDMQGLFAHHREVPAMSEESPEVPEWMAKSIAIREQIIECIGPTDRIEVYLLDPIKQPGPLGAFPLHPYGPQARTGIHEVKTLEGELAAQMLALWAGTLRDEEGRQAHCHHPIHGLRFFCVESVLFETSLCWVCNNYSAWTEQGGVWLGLPGGYPQGPATPSCAGLRQLLWSLLPIPESLVRKLNDDGTRPGKARVGYQGRQNKDGRRY
jgi:hypothetical protein